VEAKTGLHRKRPTLSKTQAPLASRGAQRFAARKDGLKYLITEPADDLRGWVAQEFLGSLVPSENTQVLS
jgi:hypothetical protein